MFRVLGRAERTRTLLLLGLVGLVTGCQRGPVAVQIDGELITVDQVVAEAQETVYDPVRDEPAELALAALRRLVVEAVVTARPLSPDETALLERSEAQRAVRQCVAVETKKLLASRFDLEQEVRERFATNPERYTLPESFRLQMIFLPATDPAGGQLAQRLLAELRQSPERFAELARRHSRSSTADAGGETRPMPGSSVHPEMRAAITAHRDSDEPFMVRLDRGWYLLRVLEYWPPPEADLQSSISQVRAAVGKQLVAELQAEIAEEVRRQHDIRVLEKVLAVPELPPETTVYTVDGSEVTVRDLVPGVAGESVPAPLVRRYLAEYRSWSEPALHLGCDAPQAPQISEEAVLALRLPTALHRFAATEMAEELASFVELHRQVLVREPHYTFDLWIMPFAGDPYRQHTRLQELLNGPKPEDEAAVADAGALFRGGVRAGTSRIDGYEPKLGPILRDATVGEVSGIIRSSRNGVFLAVRLLDQEAERPLSLDDEDDRRQIVEQLLTTSPDKVLDAFADHHLDDQQARTRLLAACAQALDAATPATGKRDRS